VAEGKADPFKAWAILEIMGHRKYGGLVTEEQIAGVAFIRLDIPESDGQPAVTQFYQPASIYCLTPTTEATARAMGRRFRPEPVSRYEVPGLLAAAPEDDAIPEQLCPHGRDADDDCLECDAADMEVDRG